MCQGSGRSAASDAIIQLVLAAPPQSVTIVALGPLTNIGAAIAAAPQVATMLKDIVVVGGTLENPSSTWMAQFVANLYWLPDIAAVRTVVESKAPITFVPVQAMLAVQLSQPWLLEVCSSCVHAPAAPLLRKLANSAVERTKFLVQLWERSLSGIVPWDAVVNSCLSVHNYYVCRRWLVMCCVHSCSRLVGAL